MTVLFLPAWIIFIASKIIFDKKKNSVKPIAISTLLGIGLSAFFWMPALFEKNLILLSQTPIADRNLYFVTIPQLLLPKWGYGVPTDPNGFTYQLGLAHFIVLFLAAFVLFRNFLKNVILRQQAEESDKLSDASFLLTSLILIFIL